MANRERGEVGFKVEGQEHILSYSANALCELEEALGEGIHDISLKMQDAAQFKLGMLRTIFWAGLIDNRPGVSMDDVKKMLAKLKISEVQSLIAEAFTLAFPQAEEADGKENPPKPDSQAA